MSVFAPLEIRLPAWVDDVARPGDVHPTRDARMRLAVELARRNVTEQLGGPFGAAVFEAGSGALVGAGVNLVTQLGNSVLHAEIVAIMTAERQVGSFTLAGDVERELYTSCEPCAMCLGAILWSGLRRVVWAASGADARDLGFDEGPVFDASHDYLERRGVELVRGVSRDAGRGILELYVERGGPIYNPR
jgi:tRNA(Arg) A34 adenosine deaminase TadA